MVPRMYLLPVRWYYKMGTSLFYQFPGRKRIRRNRSSSHPDGLFKTDKEAAEYQAKINDKVVNGRVYSSKVDGYLRAGDIRFADLNGDNVIGAGLLYLVIVRW